MRVRKGDGHYRWAVLWQRIHLTIITQDRFDHKLAHYISKIPPVHSDDVDARGRKSASLHAG